MASNASLPGLTPRQRKFVAEYAVSHNGAEAARRAGYSRHTAREYGYQLLQRPEVLSAIRQREEGEDRLIGSRRHYVLNRLQDLAERSMQAEPVRDGKGASIGVYKFDGATVARALELLGKHEGLFNERLEVRVQGEVQALLEGARPLISKQAYAELIVAVAEITGVAGVGAATAEGDRSEPAN
jgi:phage terminase small subunit